MTQTDNSLPESSLHELIIRVHGGLTRKLYDVATGKIDVEARPDGKRLEALVCSWLAVNPPLTSLSKTSGPYPSHQIYAWTEGELRIRIIICV